MKNRGLLTKHGGNPLAFVKDPVPSELPNQRFAENHDGEGETEAAVLKTGSKLRKPRKKEKPSSVADAGPRYTMRLNIGDEAAQALEELLRGLSGKSRAVAKGRIVRGFWDKIRNEEIQAGQKQPPGSGICRVDIVVPDVQKAAIYAAEKANQFEPAGSVLGRYFSPLFADYVLTLNRQVGQGEH